MKFENFNLAPQFDIFISKDSKSEEIPTFIMQYGEVVFSVTTNLLDQSEQLELQTVSIGNDVAADEVELLRTHALPQAEHFRQTLREKYSNYFA